MTVEPEEDPATNKPSSSAPAAGGGGAPDEQSKQHEMATQSPSINSNNNNSSTTQSTGQNQQNSGQPPPFDAATTSTVDSQQQQPQQSGGPARPISSLGQHPQHQQPQYPQQRWPPEALPPGSSPAGPAPGMMLASPHYPQMPQQYAQQQQHLGVPSPSPYVYGGGGQQHSPNSRPYPPPQMLHPAMIYPPPHGYGGPAGPYGHPGAAAAAQQYWAARSGANGPGLIGPPAHYPQPLQQQQPAQGPHDTPSTSRHTPQPASQQQQHQMPAPSPSAASHDDGGMEENPTLRPRPGQQNQQQHFNTPQGQLQQPPPQQQQQIPPHQQVRYSPAMLPPPHGVMPGQAFQPPPIGHHPGMVHPQMQPPHHMAPPMHHQGHPGPFPGHPGMYFPQPPHHPQAMHHQPQIGILPGLKPAQREAVEKLVMQLANPKQQMTPEMVYERRLFFEKLVLLNEQQGEMLTGPPQVSKSTVDLFALFKAVKQRGGFEKTIRDKIWKNLCTEANIDMQQSSAAGFQLRKHYQKFLLKLECLEQNLNANDLIEFAEKQKKKKKEKDPGAAQHGGAAAGPATPSSSSSVPVKEEHHPPSQQQQRPHMAPPPTSTNGSQPPPAFGGYPQGMGLQPGAPYPPPGAEFATPTSGYPMPSQPGQYPPSAAQWAAYQQQQQQQQITGASPGMYPSQQGQRPPTQMRPPHSYPGQQQDEDQQQQRVASTSSRLSSASTPAPVEHHSRASSVAGTAQDKQEQQRDEDQKDGAAGQAQQQQRQTQTPSSAFSANAPTPPLTTSTIPGSGPNSQTPSSVAAATTQQQQMPPVGYYHHPHQQAYVRYASSIGGQPGEMYTPPGQPPPGVYGSPQQPIWGSPYAQVRYHPPPGAPISRYPAYAAQPQPAASNSPQQQQQIPVPSQQPQAGSSRSATSTKLAQNAATPPFPSYGTPTGRPAGPPPGMLPAVPIMPTYIAQQFQAWFGSATMSTQPPPFPPQSLEARTIAQLQQHQQQLQQQRYRRPKVYARDLHGASPPRILMALRSALHLETCWALNALNIQLYDDTTPNAQPSLATTPELLNLLVHHFTAVLSLLFPKQFKSDILDYSNSLSSPNKNNNSSQKTSPPSTLLIPKQEPNEAAKTSHPTVTDPMVMAKEAVTLMVRPPQTSSVTTTTNSQRNRPPNFTMISRLGRHVKFDQQMEMPPDLAAELEEMAGKQGVEEKEEAADETFTDFMHRIRNQMVEQIRARRTHEKLTLFKQADNEEKDGQKDFWEMNELSEEENEKKAEMEEEEKIERKVKEDNFTENGPHLFFRQPKPWERWDRHCMDQCRLLQRSTVLQNRHADELMAEMVDRCLAISNIIRGFSFLPGQERFLAHHVGLLRILPSLLMLMVDEESQRKSGNGLPKQFTFPRPPPPEATTKEEKMESEMTDTANGVAVPMSSTAQQRQAVPAEKDSRRKWLLEVANQLRDDAFTILAHVSPNLDLFDMDNTISWPIFDSLLHWSVTTELQARDPLPPFGTIPPRHYALEILCKMSVLERNVDLMVSTGPWPRLEEFVRLLCLMICEEAPIREFAIVILNAICGVCEPACYIVAVETNLLEHLVSFLEAADANMTQIAQHQGIHTLRENPEIIGTSVGMLRRASLIMVHIVRHERCREHFHRLQHRLLQFTVSHFMDSRVAAMVADILFEMQRASRAMVKKEAGNSQDDEQASREMAAEMHKQSSERQGKLSSSAVFQPPATIEPELMFNGGETTATAENGIGGDSRSTSSSTTMYPENNNHKKGAGNGSRKRPRKSETPDSSMLENNHLSATVDEQQQHDNWNGHNNHQHNNHASMEIIDINDPVEKKGKKMISPAGVTTMGGSVRERMRNNILGKAQHQQQKKQNGWINGEPDGPAPLQNGTITGGELHGGETAVKNVEQQQSKTKAPISPPNTAATANAQSGSLTVVA